MNQKAIDLITDRIMFLKNNHTLEEIYNFEDNDKNIEGFLQSQIEFYGYSDEDMNVKVFKRVVEDLIRKEKSKKTQKMYKDFKNNMTVSNSPRSAWGSYKNKLKTNGFSDDSIYSIEKSAEEILHSLTDTKNEEVRNVKGLVVGNVQSGKTANMAALMAMAADNGINMIIVLSGVIENLRIQTLNRLSSDLSSNDECNINWRPLQNTKPGAKSKYDKISNLNFNSPNVCHFTVCLKNKTRLNDLYKWLTEDSNKTKQLKILIIDDEADQASINTKDIQSDEEGTAIYNAIKKIVDNKTFKAMNYVAYTATPYANILNDSSSESLYPKDFIYLLDPANEYIGPKQIFGIQEPETNKYLDIVKEVSEKDFEIIQEIHKGESFDLPESMKEAIKWYLISLSALRTSGYKKPLTFLVHTSYKVQDHGMIAEAIVKYLKYLKRNFKIEVERMREQYILEKHTLSKSDFLKVMDHKYSKEDDIYEYPDFSEIRDELEKLMDMDEKTFISYTKIEDSSFKFHKGLHLAIDNSSANSISNDEHKRLIYPEKSDGLDFASAFIVIGGNTLSRGLTLEGLVTTYFLRNTKQADTLMQMGRWFGYRFKYELFPRIWMDENTRRRFLFLSQMNEELREEIREFASSKKTPAEYAVRIKNSPNYRFIKITSGNKMQSVVTAKYDFSGFNSQTIYYENNEEVLRANNVLTEEFLNDLPVPKEMNNNLLWENVSIKDVEKYIEKFKINENDIQMSAMKYTIEWCNNEKNIDKYRHWNIVLINKNKLEKCEQKFEEEFIIHGYKINPVIRTRLNKSNDVIVNIGALRSPSDLYADIDKELMENEKIPRNSAKREDIYHIRKIFNKESTPLLIIYYIDKDSMPSQNGKNSNASGRKSLNLPINPIGLNLLIPGEPASKNINEYITVEINEKEIHGSYVEEDNED